MLDLRRSMVVNPTARLVPMALHPFARTVQTAVRARGLTPADVVAASYPRSGSTWLRFVIADIASQGTDVDFLNIADLSAPLGSHRDAPALIDGRGRFIKTHESFRAFPWFTARGLYLVRDGRDVAVSLYHWLRRWNVYRGPFEDYLPAFLHGRVVNYGSWQEHVASWQGAAARRSGSIVVLRYEDLLGSDGAEILRHTLVQIGWDVPAEVVELAMKRNVFEKMKQKGADADAHGTSPRKQADTSVPVVRKGSVGQWREVFSDDQTRMFKDAAGRSLERSGYEI